MLLTLFRWVHVVAASLWLGSLVFIMVVMRAPVQEFGKQMALEPMLVRFRRRYKGLLIATVAALAVSGITALAVRHARVNALYVILLIVKILISVGVIALFWYVAFVREGPSHSARARAVPAPDTVSPDAGESLAPSEQATVDVDFFFRPKKYQALMQWWIVGATAAAILLGLLVARLGAGLAEREAQERRSAEEATGEVRD